MTTTIQLIKQLREASGAGIADCRNALLEANGKFDLALVILEEQARVQAALRADRETCEGRIELYSHGDGRIGVMVEIGAETDFVARSEAFRNFAHEVALQIAAANPCYVRDEDIPPDVLAEEAGKAAGRARSEGKAEFIIPRIVEGSLKKFKDRQVLMRQAYIRDDKLPIADLLSQTAAILGENIVIRRFVRWEIVDGNIEK